MSIRPISILLLAAGVFAMGIGLAHLPTASMARKVAPRVVAGSVDLQELPITALPTVYVHADAELPVLPRVVVRPSTSELAAAAASRTHHRTDAHRDDVAMAVPHVTNGTVPVANFDMPYYSFGDAQPRTSKE
ncbi:MAG TPA: hypothetical protein VFG55_01380 [Rhodanobacteraceae bacterium]|nr:hypothetical protein [Rhodanobacteraceae bacterium]